MRSPIHVMYMYLTSLLFASIRLSIVAHRDSLHVLSLNEANVLVYCVNIRTAN